MARCGLRAAEVTYSSDTELRYSDDTDGWLLKIHGRDTKSGKPTVRDAWMAEPVEANVCRFARERNRATAEAWVQASTSSVRRWIREAAEHVIEADPQADRCSSVTSSSTSIPLPALGLSSTVMAVENGRDA